MSNHLRAMWREAADRSRGMDYAMLWGANEPEFWVVGDAPPMIGGDWHGHVVLARGSLSYGAALNPTAFVNDLVSKAQQTVRSGNLFVQSGSQITTLYLIVRGRGREGMNAGGASWVVGEMPVGGRQFQPTSTTIQGEYRTAVPSPRMMNAMMYSSGEEVRKWIGENLAGVVTDESMFEGVPETVTVYRGISLVPGADPLTSLKDTGGVGSSWTVDQDTAKAIAERGSAGFSSGAQVLGDTYRLDLTSDRIYQNWVPTVLRAEVTLMPPEQGGPAPYRPWTIDYAHEAEIDIPQGTEVVVNGVMQATPVVRATQVNDISGREETLVTFTWPTAWQAANVRRTAVEDYMGGHTAPSGEDDVAAPMHDVEMMMPDYYDRPDLYRHDRGPVDRECQAAIIPTRGKPEAMVTIYRALPQGYTMFNTGDWVTPSLTYARQHAMQYEGEDWPVITATVPAKTLWTEGYAAEWGYSGPSIPGKVV